MYANLNGGKVSPEKGLRAECPFCEEEVFAKCGDFKTWHFSHLAGSQCSFGDGKGSIEIPANGGYNFSGNLVLIGTEFAG